MADNKPGYALVPGDGGRASGLIRRRMIDEEGGSGSSGGGGFLDLSLGSIYNNPSTVADDGGGGLSPVASTLLPAPNVASVGAAATAPYAPLARVPAFALGHAASAVTAADGNGGGHVRFLAANNALAAATNQQIQVPPAPSVLPPPPLFAGDGIIPVPVIPVPVPVPVHGNTTDASSTVPAAAGDSGATSSEPPRSKGAVTTSDAPPPANRKSRRTDRRRRSSGASAVVGDDAADAADALAAPTLKAEQIDPPPPFPWATKTSGTHPTLAELTERGITTVDGEVRCKRCDAGKTISYEIAAKFAELSWFILRNAEAMHDRAPPEWMCPALPDCDKCGQKNSLRPVIAAEKWRINWMFLLLGQTLGLCTLEQLKHFCARTRQHRTGAKDRVLYSTYMELCNQLCPGGPFDMASERKNRTRLFA